PQPPPPIRAKSLKIYRDQAMESIAALPAALLPPLALLRQAIGRSSWLRRSVMLALLAAFFGVVSLGCAERGDGRPWSFVATLRALLDRLWVLAARTRRSALISDPTFGGALGLVYSRDRVAQSWEDFLDALNFPKSSPIRGHVRQLFSRPELDDQLRGLFDALSSSPEGLSRGDFERFSLGIRGDVHMLLRKRGTKVQLVTATAEDLQWIIQSFDSVFPPERPLEHCHRAC
ncbi:unnamed protein product, partial [Polarella glacialis]